MDDELLFKDECYSIQGAVFEVYRFGERRMGVDLLKNKGEQKTAHAGIIPAGGFFLFEVLELGKLFPEFRKVF